MGQAQVRKENSVENVPAMLHVAAIEVYGPGGEPAVFPEAKWREPGKSKHRLIRKTNLPTRAFVLWGLN